MEPLIFKIETQADDSGVRQYDKSLGGLDVSSRKASGALKSFSHELLQAKSGADVAAAGAESLSRVIEKSLAGAVVIGGIKIVSDQINKMSEILRSSGEAASAAITQLERMGEIKGIDDATTAVGVLNTSIDTIEKSLGAIRDGNWFAKLTGSITGTTEELGKLLASQQKLRDGLIAEGFLAERIKLETMSRLNDEQKQYEQIQQTLRKNLELADKIQNDADRAVAKDEANAMAGIQNINLTSSLMAEQSKKEEEASNQRQKEIDARIKKEQELAEVQQKRFNDLYDAEVKAQEATQKRIDANIKGEKDLADNLQKLREAEEEAKKNVPIGVVGGGGGGTTSGRPSVPGLTRDPSQKPSSAETGAQQMAERAYIEGLKKSADALRQYYENQLKANGAVSDYDAVTRKLMESTADLAREQGEAQYGIKDFLDGVRKAAENLYEFQKTTQDAVNSLNKFDTEMSKVEPAFDRAKNSAEKLADSITKNTGDMVSAFLKTETKTTDLGKNFSDLGKTVDGLANKLDKVGDQDKEKQKDKGKGLDDVYRLLDDNLKEMRTYAHAT